MALYSCSRSARIIVAVTEVATSSDLLEESTSSLLVAVALTVLLFPLLALSILSRWVIRIPPRKPPSRKETDERKSKPSVTRK